MSNFTFRIDGDIFESNMKSYLKFAMNKLYMHLGILLLSSLSFIFLSTKIELLQHIEIRILWSLIIFRILLKTLYINSFVTSVYKKQSKLIKLIKNSNSQFFVNTVINDRVKLHKTIVSKLREHIERIATTKNNKDLVTTFYVKAEDPNSSVIKFELNRSYIKISNDMNILVVDLPIVRSNLEALQPISVLLLAIKVE
jgi:hypothetical protein